MRIARSFSLLPLLLLFAAGGLSAQEQEAPETPEAPQETLRPPVEGEFRILDKITGRVRDEIVIAGERRSFGNLEILLHYCRASAPEERAEVVVFAEIFYRRAGQEEPARVFSGWMFASSPSVHAMEHPLYDVWPIACKTSSGDKSSFSA